MVIKITYILNQIACSWCVSTCTIYITFFIVGLLEKDIMSALKGLQSFLKPVQPASFSKPNETDVDLKFDGCMALNFCQSVS